MLTPTTHTTDHHEPRAPGACPCTPASICPECMGKLQRLRHDLAVQRWLDQWDSIPRPAPSRRPLLRLVHGGRR